MSDAGSFNATHPSALAIYCSDGRFTDAVEQLMHGLGHPRLDVLCIPGGPALLTHWSATVSDADMVRRSASFLIQGHAITHVVLLAHHGCGYYRHRYLSATPEEMERRQLNDLSAAGVWLAGAHPRIKLEAYYAEVVDQRIHFQPVPRKR